MAVAELGRLVLRTAEPRALTPTPLLPFGSGCAESPSSVCADCECGDR